MKKKYSLTILLLMFIEFLYLASSTKAYYCRIDFLTTDKSIYYINDEIKINASWELNYNPNTELAFVQVQIFNQSNKIIWTSSEFNNIGVLEENWTINCNNLNISFSNYSRFLYIKFFCYYFQFDSTNTVSTFLETIEIKIVKRNLSCQLSGFKDNLNIGENLNFKAKFFDSSLEDQDLVLCNETILFKVESNNQLTHQHNYTTNETGVINVFLDSNNHLKLGYNKLIFVLKNNWIYNDSKFMYEIFIGKNPIFVDIVKFRDNISNQEDLEISLYYYYFSNQSSISLTDKCIKIKIFENSTLKFINEYFTDNLGMLVIKVANDVFNFEQKSKIFTISLIFDGSNILENKTLYLRLRITEVTNLKKQDSMMTNILPISVVLILISIVLSYIFINNKKRNAKPLTDITIRY